MKILGISGSMHRTHENSPGNSHDASAVLVIDGKVVAAIEEERLNRIKHTDKFPLNAIKFVLRQAGIQLQEVDQICYYMLRNYFFEDDQSIPLSNSIRGIIADEFGYEVPEDKLYFVHHHLAHAVSSFYMSGFQRSLVMTIDGTGDGVSGMIFNGKGKELQRLETFTNEDSLGIYYLKVIHLLGYKQFDEYKVMGLAPYGNPATYRDLFKSFYTLLPEGKYRLNSNKVKKLYLLAPRRKKDEPFTQLHKDIAAALQESLEEIVMHILKHYQKKFNHTALCLAGGVAHNCSVNGKILYSGLFEDIFVQPAAHDAGCALGAALYRYYELNRQQEPEPLAHVYWGTPIAGDDKIEQLLDHWQGFLSYKKHENIASITAQLLAEGHVIGWVQGCSEFGPRALGNRSIIADPRPAANKDIINEMVKKREAYRPFAPSILEEYVDQYYDIPTGYKRFPYMIFVVKVREDKQELLGAVTHTDGTSRIQTVSSDVNPRYWQLIDEFRKITGIPIVLNTSFNNNAEPIVDSVNNAIVCYLSTKLNYLVIGDYLIEKKEIELPGFSTLIPGVPVHNFLNHKVVFDAGGCAFGTTEIWNNFGNGHHTLLSEDTFHLLSRVDGRQTLGELFDSNGFFSDERKSKVINEILILWGKRFVHLSPVSSSKRPEL